MDENLTSNEIEGPKRRFPSTLILIGIGILLLIAAVLLYPQARQQLQRQQFNATQESLPSLVAPSPTPTGTPAPAPAEVVDPEIYAYPSQFGTLILSLREGSDIHLFAYQPFLEDYSGEGFSGLPLTRLTAGQQQDITPAISPDGRQLAFSSNRSGAWDIYILDLFSGELRQFTDTSAYDAHPSWSPDGKWLVYESYQSDNLEILIQDLDQTIGEIPLTINPAADFSPDWSPQGRWISFISSRSGRLEVWYADLDSAEEDKAVQIKNPPSLGVKHPSWSAEGRYLTWAIMTRDGVHKLVTWDSQQPELEPVDSGRGDWPQWGGAGEILYTIVDEPASSYLTAYPGDRRGTGLILPAVELPGRVEGLSWIGADDLSWITDLSSGPSPTPLWGTATGGQGSLTRDLVQLRDVAAPNPQIHQDAADSFTGLRAAVGSAAGWDFLSTLENAYVPLEEPLPPGVNLDWLHTGRGLMVNDIPRLADWLVLVREDYGSQTYWRVFIRANDQQGLQGRPLQSFTWDLNARYSGSNADYENGGSYSQDIPRGYWVDFTSLAEVYGWQRFPAETYWQFAERASRYQYFSFRQGLSLQEALSQLYSQETVAGFLNSTNR